MSTSRFFLKPSFYPLFRSFSSQSASPVTATTTTTLPVASFPFHNRSNSPTRHSHSHPSPAKYYNLFQRHISYSSSTSLAYGFREKGDTDQNQDQDQDVDVDVDEVGRERPGADILLETKPVNQQQQQQQQQLAGLANMSGMDKIIDAYDPFQHPLNFLPQEKLSKLEKYRLEKKKRAVDANIQAPVPNPKKHFMPDGRVWTKGGRKTAKCTVYTRKSDALSITINGKPMIDYIFRLDLRMEILRPLGYLAPYFNSDLVNKHAIANIQDELQNSKLMTATATGTNADASASTTANTTSTNPTILKKIGTFGAAPKNTSLLTHPWDSYILAKTATESDKVQTDFPHKNEIIGTGKLANLEIEAFVTGGGYRGQAEAIRYAIAKAAYLLNPECKAVLTAHGLLKRDTRIREEKKYGRHKARKGFRWSKR